MNLKFFNIFIVPTCWNEVYSIYMLDECHLYKCGGGAAFYETWIDL
jgi:hypothetical protein